MYKILQLIQSVFQLKWHQHIKILLQKPFPHSHNFLGDQLRTQDCFYQPTHPVGVFVNKQNFPLFLAVVWTKNKQQQQSKNNSDMCGS